MPLNCSESPLDAHAAIHFVTSLVTNITLLKVSHAPSNTALHDTDSTRAIQTALGVEYIRVPRRLRLAESWGTEGVVVRKMWGF